MGEPDVAVAFCVDVRCVRSLDGAPLSRAIAWLSASCGAGLLDVDLSLTTEVLHAHE
ncbi:hypothetical protein [Tessaracoccus caeni]|uniref:hypothetical protein n=1 Tax=Tessaracoccus caeni TaxID=3031239 RepID=UPI0023DC8DA5|nr:hypothetical protein [Tessaracoccus caeni]MDF1488708.1 hypothetical protein [Tessaracoccus caeni]